MAQDIVNKNQDISYTNLDFSTIYTELVDLAKQLSYRWDPSISDESDPGVVLLKLSALLADKMNYNIDKSVLEAFPLSVTQEGSARQLYEQLGYYMNWYESAVVPINFTWIGEKLNAETVYTIPRFTIITDSESSLSYTLIGTYRNNDLIVSDCKLPADGTTVQMIAMEGTPTTYSFLGETKITSQMIDENNRLYFETKYISQNGIFIRNSGNDQDNYSEWKRVDNLYEQPYNGLRYKFGIDSVSDVAYLEFPDNYAELIGSGIEIVYLVIDPEFSNIPTQVLDRFLVNVTPSEASSVVLSIDNVKIENTTPAYGHKNAESINQAYTNYKRTVGTFKTLITLRDYLNYLLLEGEELCSNGFVTDRTNDPQVSYKIMSKVHGTDSLITAVEADDVYESVKINALDFVENEGKYYTYNNNTQESGFRQCSTSDIFNDTEQYFISDTPSGNVYQSIPLGTLTEFELGVNYYTYSSASSSSSAEFTQCTDESLFSPDLKYFTRLNSVYESADDKDFTLEGITKKFKSGVHYYELASNNSEFVEVDTSSTEVDPSKVYFLHKEYIYRTANISQADFNDNKTLYYYIPSDGEFTFTQVSISTAPDYRVIHKAGQDDDFENVFILNKDHYYVNVGTSEEPQYEVCDASSVYDNDKDYAVQEQRVVSEPDSNTQYFTQTVNTRYISVTPTEVEFERNPAKYYTHNSLNHKFTIADTYSSKENYFVQKESDKMTPFSLKFYLLQDAVGVNSRVTFDQTFEMISSDDLPSIDALIEDTSHIEHTYEDILPFGENTYILTTDTNRDPNKSYYRYNPDSGVYEFISNSYYTLTDDMSVLDVIDEDTGRTVKKKYYKYNAQYDYYYEVDTTGIKVPYEYQLYELVILTDTTDVNPSSMGWYEIDTEALSPHIAYFRAKYPLTLTISTFQVVGVDIQRDIKNNILNAFYEHLNSSQLEFGDKIELDYLTEVVLNADTRIKSVLFDNINYTIEAVYYDYHKQQFISRVLPTNLSLPEYTDEDSVIGYTLAKDVFAKSILAGTTTLLDEDTKFAYHLNQYYITDTGDNGVYSITSETVIDMNNVSTEISAGSSLAKNYTLKENEVIHLYRPKLINLNEYATGVHYEYLINTDIEEGQSYQLSKYEYIIFYTTDVDENGVTTGYKGKAYTNGAIIKPSFKIKAQPSQEGLSEYFRTQWQDTILRQSDSVYDCDTYSIYWVSVIQNNASIINNVIQGSNSITIQKMSTVTITPEDGYKFYWTLNDEQKSENTNKRFYELFQGFDSDSDTDKRNNGTINTYTLKSGETLYYIDKDAKNLAILHEGTTITRNCGTLNDYQEIDSNDLLDYINYDDVKDDYTFITEYGEVSPRANGFYDDTFTRSEDPFVIQGKTYYILAMKSTAGLYENINNIYTPCGDTTYDIFEQVALDDELLDSINPHDDGLYEKINYEGYVIEDSYAAKYLDDTDYEGISLSRPRYALSLDSTVFNTQVFTSLPNKFESNDVSKYPESITLDNNTITTFSPLVNNLYEVNESSDSLGTFYTDSEAHNLAQVEVDSCPVAEGWYEVIDGSVVLSQKMYAYNPVSADRCTETTPFNEIEANGDSQVYSCYYRFSKDNTVYHKTSSSNPYITLSSSAENVPLTLYNICSRILGSNPTDRLTLNAIDNFWSTRITETLPSGFSVMGFRKLDNNETSDNPYYFISSSAFDATRADLISSNINNDSPLYCGSIEKTVDGVTTTVNGYFLKNVSGIDSVDSDVYTMDDYRIITDTDIQLWYSAVAKLGSSYASYTPIFFIPLYYKFKYLVSLNSTTYYKLKTYATGSYGVIAPWQCDSLSSDYIVNNPSRALTDYWQTIQNNCSITITENDTYSLSEGDTLSIVSSGLSTDNSKIKWPVFSNTDIILNLDNYIVSYTRSDHNVTTLDSININGMTWRGYSSLLLNTSDTFGQIVESHHKISFLDKDKEVLYAIPDDVPGGMNTSKQLIFQLKDPIDNKTGDVISVYTYDSLGNEVPNSMYLFYRIFDTDHIVYNTNYETTLLFTGTPTIEQPLQIELPFNLQPGDYLVPINTVSNVHLRCDLNQNVYDKNNFKPVGVIDAWSEGVEYYTYDNQSYTPVSDYTNPPNPEVFYYVVDGYSKGTVNVTPITDFAQSTTVFTGDRTYYLSINIPENTTGYDVDYALMFTSNSEANIVLGDVFKYEPNDILTEVDAYDEIFNRVKSLDKNNIYNYTFQPSDNDIIENPLLPESFWNKNHVYNEYTIPQLDLSSADNLYYKFITSR